MTVLWPFLIAFSNFGSRLQIDARMISYCSYSRIMRLEMRKWASGLGKVIPKRSCRKMEVTMLQIWISHGSSGKGSKHMRCLLRSISPPPYRLRPDLTCFGPKPGLPAFAFDPLDLIWYGMSSSAEASFTVRLSLISPQTQTGLHLYAAPPTKY